MILIITILIVGSALAYISQYNLEPVTVSLGTYLVRDIPLFYVIAGSILVGLVLAYLLQLVRNIGSFLTLRGKHREIKSGRHEILSLTKRIHELEIENEKLKHRSIEPPDVNAL